MAAAEDEADLGRLPFKSLLDASSTGLELGGCGLVDCFVAVGATVTGTGPACCWLAVAAKVRAANAAALAGKW